MSIFKRLRRNHQTPLQSAIDQMNELTNSQVARELGETYGLIQPSNTPSQEEIDQWAAEAGAILNGSMSSEEIREFLNRLYQDPTQEEKHRRFAAMYGSGDSDDQTS